MKILHIEDRFNPEMGYQLNFISKFHNETDEMIILSSYSLITGQPYSAEIDAEFEKKYNISIIRIPSLFVRKNKTNLWLLQLKKTIHNINPDIIFIHGIENYTAFRIFSDKKITEKYKVVGDTHTLRNQFNNSIKFKIYFWMQKMLVIKKINKYKTPIFYTVPENKEILLDIYKINPELVYPFEIGTDPDIYFRDEDLGMKTKLNQGFDTNDKVILYVGKINKNKQPNLILEAIKIIEDCISDKLHVLFIGSKDDQYFKEKMSVISFSNPLINVHFLPFFKNNELYKYYSMADFGVFPKENTLSALDSQACGLPIIMEDDATNDLRLKKGGLLYNQNSIKDLANKIKLLLNDRDLLNKLSIEGQTYIIDRFSYKTNIKKMEVILLNYYNQINA